MTGYRLTLGAEDDLRDIWRYSHQVWGAEQADAYLDRIKTCCQRLAEGQAHFKPVRLVDREVFLSHCASHLLFFETGDPVVIP
ncbi:MAG: type II toxin-antitoxin system RelE/ParE family toxin, partial [Silicimonas sp.]|nr:type II toxin-antitoxin system RelE/ParE family toxin [Silicimonas sp.]